MTPNQIAERIDQLAEEHSITQARLDDEKAALEELQKQVQQAAWREQAKQVKQER